MSNKQPVSKNKLFMLKKWVTIPEAAQYLSASLGEEVNEADIYALVLNDQLKISIKFIDMINVEKGKLIYNEDFLYKETFFSDNVIKQFDGGIFELQMYEGGKKIIEEKYYNLIGGPKVKRFLFLEDIVFGGDDGQLYRLVEWLENKNSLINDSENKLLEIEEKIKSQNIAKKEAEELLSLHKKKHEKLLDSKVRSHPDEYLPLSVLPEDTMLVVCTQALIDLQNQLLEDKPTEVKPLASRSETTYLNIIGALLEYISGESHGIEKHPAFSSEAKLIEHFCQLELPGLSKSTLESKFAVAKRSINSC